jgi:hypothetical protein
LYSEFVSDSFYFAGDCNLRLAELVVYYFDVGPRDFAPPARAEQFKYCFFCGESAGEFFHIVFVSIGVLLFRGREDTVEKALAVPVNHFRDSGEVYQVYTVCDIHWNQFSPLLLALV